MTRSPNEAGEHQNFVSSLLKYKRLRSNAEFQCKILIFLIFIVYFEKTLNKLN